MQSVNHSEKTYEKVRSQLFFFIADKAEEMNKSSSVAKQFSVYSRLGWIRRWLLISLLKWIYKDSESLDLLFNFERELVKRSLPVRDIYQKLETALIWYNREIINNHLQDPLRPDKLPEILQVLLIFLAKDQKPLYGYRQIILNIIHSGDNIRRSSETNSIITPEWFRIEAANLIFDMNYQRWDEWHPYLLEFADRMLVYLENLASKVDDRQVFTQFRREAVKLPSKLGWGFEKSLRYLEKIADKVNNLHSCTIVFQGAVPVMGLETTAYLISLFNDFKEFEVYYLRINSQLDWWHSHFIVLFHKATSISELNQILLFLETLSKNTYMEKYSNYKQTHHSGKLHQFISRALLEYKDQILHACLDHDWKNEQKHDQFANVLIAKFEQNVIKKYLDDIWHSTKKFQNLRWEFDKFADYIPYDMRNMEWTIYAEKTRSYSNSKEAEGLAYGEFIGTLEPLLQINFPILDLTEIEVLFEILPDYLSVHQFTKTVKVPVDWKKDIIIQEGYNKWAGFYNEEIEIARPQRFIEKTFTFESPYLENAIELLSSMKNVDEAIQAHKNSRQ